MLNKDFKEFLELLNSAGVEYLVVGGYALTSIDGVDFEQGYRNRVVMNVGGTNLSIIGVNDFRANKRAAGRAQDIADLESLDDA